MTWVAIALTLVGIIGFLSAVLIRLLRQRHPETHEQLGAPSFVSTDLRTNWRTFRFIWSSEGRRLEDAEVTRICWLIRVYCVILGLWFLWPFVL